MRQIIGRSNWMLYNASSLTEATTFYSERQIPVVVCDSQLPDGDWRALIDGIARTDIMPAVIISSHQVDNRMWAEVLNLGAYDLLAKPFDATEVLRAVALAWHSWRRACDLPAPRKIAAGSEAGCEGRELARLAVAG